MKMRSLQSLTIAGITAVAVACVLFVAVQDTRISHAGSRSAAIAGNTTIQSFSKAKKLMRQVFARH